MDLRLQQLDGLERRPIALWRERGWWGRAPLWERVERTATAEPGRAAVLDAGHVLTYGSLWSSALRYAAAIRSAGLGRRDIALVQLPNWHEFVIAAVAAEISEVVFAFCPVQWGLRETTRALQLIRPKLWITTRSPRSNDDRGALITEVLQAAGKSALTTVLLRSGSLPSAQRAENWLPAFDLPERRMFDPGHGTDPVEIAVTSGSTGDPKGVLHVHDSAILTINSTIQRQAITASDIIHLAVPVGHTFGYFYGVRCALQAGATLLLQERWNAGQMAELVATHKASVSLGPSAFLIDLLALGSAALEPLASLRLFTHGGDSLPSPLVRNLMEAMPFRISRAFGMTEFGHACSTDARTTREQCMRSVGTPQSEMMLKIQDDAGRDLPPNQEGRIVVSGPFLFAGYITPDTINQDVLSLGGFFDTGDLGIVDEEGCLQITGRVKNVIRRGAETIPVSLLEDLIASNPAVIHAVVVGIPNFRLGEVPVACVQLKPGCTLSLDDVGAMFEAERITKKFWPADLRIFNEWPVGATGKIDRRLIAERVQASVQS